MKLSQVIKDLQEVLIDYGDIEGDVLVEDLSDGGFGQIEQEFGGVAVSPGRTPDLARFKLLSKDFT